MEVPSNSSFQTILQPVGAGGVVVDDEVDTELDVAEEDDEVDEVLGAADVADVDDVDVPDVKEPDELDVVSLVYTRT